MKRGDGFGETAGALLPLSDVQPVRGENRWGSSLPPIPYITIHLRVPLLTTIGVSLGRYVTANAPYVVVLGAAVSPNHARQLANIRSICPRVSAIVEKMISLML